tara:strand:- start:108 stop:353 length:246 start_codon:yes stop_codon:yes gene_type:complete
MDNEDKKLTKLKESKGDKVEDVPEKGIDLNALFPDEKNDLNVLFPDFEIKELLKKVCKNHKDIEAIKQVFKEDVESPESES